MESMMKINRGMILAPLVGIIVNLVEASTEVESSDQNDIIEVLAPMDFPETVLFGLQYMLDFNWTSFSKGNVHFFKLRQLEEFFSCLVAVWDLENQKRPRAGKNQSAMRVYAVFATLVWLMQVHPLFTPVVLWVHYPTSFKLAKMLLL